MDAEHMFLVQSAGGNCNEYSTLCFLFIRSGISGIIPLIPLTFSLIERHSYFVCFPIFLFVSVYLSDRKCSIHTG